MINVLNTLSSNGDFELLLESAPDLLDAVAESLDRHNTLLPPLRAKLAREAQRTSLQRGRGSALSSSSSAVGSSGPPTSGNAQRRDSPTMGLLSHQLGSLQVRPPFTAPSAGDHRKSIQRGLG